jgi:heptaprenyl diphosphate synthase
MNEPINAAARDGSIAMPLAIPADVLAELEADGVGVLATLDAVEERLLQRAHSSHAFTREVSRYLIDAGGKRFRPLLVCLAGHLPKAAQDDVPFDALADAGVIVELVHLATLYHDDVIDDAPARRGITSAHLRWTNTLAILTGDFLMARASELSAELGVEVTRIISQTLARLCEGQIAEVQGAQTVLPEAVPVIAPSVAHYLDVVSGKTASLIETSCRYGALLSGGTAQEVEAAARYGFHVGMAFQFSDDILDIASDPHESGKIPGTDLKEGVLTLPVLYALEDDPEGELAALLATPLDDDSVAKAVGLLRANPALDRARATAEQTVQAAIDELAVFPEGAATRALTRLTRYAITRLG